jgi:hypothetical protein
MQHVMPLRLESYLRFGRRFQSLYLLKIARVVQEADQRVTLGQKDLARRFFSAHRSGRF